MTNADTYTITTKVAKAQVVLRKWITGKAREDIEAILMNAMSVDVNTAQEGSGKLNNAGQAYTDHKHKEIEAFVVSVNGSEEGVVEAVLSLPEADTNLIREEIKKNSHETDE